MSEKIIKYIVYALSLLIGIAFIAVVYGMYIKIIPKSSKNNIISEDISLQLDQNYKIKNMQVIDEDTILVTVEIADQIQGIIYDINKKKIIQKLNK